MKRILSICSVVFVATAPMNSADLNTGYTTTMKYRSWSDWERTLWCSGFVDGLACGSVFKGDAVQKLADGIEGKNLEQIRAMIDKYIANKPEVWHFPVSLSALSALAPLIDSKAPPNEKPQPPNPVDDARPKAPRIFNESDFADSPPKR